MYKLDERETILNYDYITQTWHGWSCVPKHINRMKKCGWTLVKQTEENRIVIDATFTAPKNAVTIRSLCGAQKNGTSDDDEGEDE